MTNGGGVRIGGVGGGVCVFVCVLKGTARLMEAVFILLWKRLVRPKAARPSRVLIAFSMANVAGGALASGRAQRRRAKVGHRGRCSPWLRHGMEAHVPHCLMPVLLSFKHTAKPPCRPL